MEASDNPYHILGLSETATAKEIRTAYRRLALQYHPDRPSGDTVKFAQIHRAYETLSRTEPTAAAMKVYQDPLAMFEKVFREEFWDDRDAFVPFGSRGGSVFDQDPFFARGSMFPKHSFGLFGDSRMEETFGRMDDLFDRANPEDTTHNNVSYYSSSSISRRDSNGRWVTETKYNRNGETSTEYMERDTDGNIILEHRRTVNGNPTSSSQPQLEGGGSNESMSSKRGFFRLPWRRDA